MFELLRHKSVKIICAFVLLCLMLICVVSERKIYTGRAQSRAYSIDTITNEQIESVVDENINKLMIVAHPDDEVLWGGGHLMTHDYLVVCVTNGNQPTRSAEFQKVIEESGNKFIMLGYPDKVGGRRDNWSSVKDSMQSDLGRIMNFKHWNLIVTHNQNGEYGHIQHQSVHSFVTEIFDSEGIDSTLYCFGKYYTAKRIGAVKSKLTPISAEEYAFKKKLADIYASQGRTVENLWHMARYEEWTEYEKYSEHPQLKYKQKQDDNTKNGVIIDEA